MSQSIISSARLPDNKNSLAAMENLEAQYDQIVRYLEDYHAYVEKIVRRWRRAVMIPVGAHRDLINQVIPLIWKPNNPLSEKSREQFRVIMGGLATEEEKRDPFFKVVTSDYTMEALSECLIMRFNSFSFEKLKKIHEMKHVRLAAFRLKQTIGVVFAASALVLNTAPKSVIEGPIKYESFQKAVFWTTTSLAVFLFVALLNEWRIFRRAKEKHREVGDLLEYTLLKTT